MIYKLNPKESKHSMDSRSPGITQFEERAGHNLKNSRLAQPRAGDNPAGKRTAEGNKNINNQSRKNLARHNCNEHKPPLPRRGKRRICLCESAVSAQQKLLLGLSWANERSFDTSLYISELTPFQNTKQASIAKSFIYSIKQMGFCGPRPN